MTSLKTLELSTSPDPTNYVLESWVATVFVIEFEILLGLLLFTRTCYPASRLLAMATFTVFATFSSIKATNGISDCGCFGTIPVNPWLSVSISMVSVLVVANWKRDKWRPITPTIAAIVMSAMSAVLFAVLSLNTTTFNNLGGD